MKTLKKLLIMQIISIANCAFSEGTINNPVVYNEYDITETPLLLKTKNLQINKSINDMKTISEKGLQLIKEFEGCELQTYKCPAGILTIGYGHTGSDVKKGMKITQNTAEELLKKDLETFERHVNQFYGDTINQNQFDALVSFCYNVGPGNLKLSTLNKMVKNNPGDIAIIDEFKKWKYANKKVLQGLVKRREAEAQLYFLNS